MPEPTLREAALINSPLELTTPFNAEAAAWDDFVEQHPEGRFSQLWGFREVLEGTYGYRSVYRKILRGGEWIGVFPSIVAGHRPRTLISHPFNEYGGPLTQQLSASESVQLAEILLRLGKEENCESIEIRGGIGCELMAESPVCKKHHLYSYAALALQEKERLWRQPLTQEARKAIKRGQNAGLHVEILRGASAVDARFYELYLVSMKRLGVPPHPKAFFSNLANGFGNRLVSAAVGHEGRDVAYLLAILTGKRIQVYITASAPQGWPLRPNDLAHWELMNWAFTNGVRTFDFGSARYAGQIHFKQKWGATFRDYNYYLIGETNSKLTSQVQSVDSSSKLMLASAALWRRVVPLRLSRVLGRPIRKYLTK
jgi:CelD/BcsL family acetyltransferase involved in cellulose biosynthesis